MVKAKYSTPSGMRFWVLIVAAVSAVTTTSCGLFNDDEQLYSPYFKNKDGTVEFDAHKYNFNIEFDINMTEEACRAILDAHGLEVLSKNWDLTYVVRSVNGRPAIAFLSTYKRPGLTLGDSSFINYAMPELRQVQPATGGTAWMNNLVHVDENNETLITEVESVFQNATFERRFIYGSPSRASTAFRIIQKQGATPVEIMQFIDKQDNVLKVWPGSYHEVSWK